MIIPPIGTTKNEIDEIFGQPQEVKELTGKGSNNMYPMHIYTLVLPENNQGFRAFLAVTYRDENKDSIYEVYCAGINHVCVVKNRDKNLGQKSKKKKIEKF